VTWRRSIPFWPLALLVLPLLASLGVPQFQPLPPGKKEGPPLRKSLPPQGTTVTVPADCSWRKNVVTGPMVWLAEQQNGDGSWGDAPGFLEGHRIGRAGVTALVLLSILGNGYSHLSADVYDRTQVGKVIARGLQWLLKDQRGDGTFSSLQDGGLDQALAAFALSEAYGMTASQPFKAPAQNALDALLRLQGRDGSWGGPAPTAWALEALISGELSELTVPKEAKLGGLRSMTTAAHPASLLELLRLTNSRKTCASKAEALAAAPPGVQDCAAWYHGSVGLYKYDGPEGPEWKKWSASMQETLVSARDGERGWKGGTPSYTIMRSSLTLLALQTRFRYRHGFGGSPP
jgi:hypothetical protein